MNGRIDKTIVIKERKGRAVNKMFKILTFFSFYNFSPLMFPSPNTHDTIAFIA